MTNEQEDGELLSLLDGLKIDAAGYFKRAEEALEGVEISESSVRWPTQLEGWVERDRYWTKLPEQIRGEAKRLSNRLISLMGHVARAVRNAPLSSEADQRDVMTGTKTMRAALLLRRFSLS
jgi:hypothetical protein